MNNITKQVITELETIKAIASELADMSPRTQMEIVALCKEICLNVDKVLEKNDIDLTTLFEYVQTIESELKEIRQLIDPQHLALIDERLEDLEASILTINESIGGINETLSTHTSQIQGLENSKQDTLTAGANIQINNGVISATDTTYTAGNNITIENGVISASGGSIELYKHTIELYRSGNTSFTIFFDYYSNSSQPLSNNNTSKLKLINKKFLINGNVTTMLGDTGIYIPISVTFGASTSTFTLRCERVTISINASTQVITYSHTNVAPLYSDDYYIQSDTITRIL